MNDFMAQTTKTLANSDQNSSNLSIEIKKLRKEQSKEAQPSQKKQRVDEEGDISLNLDEEVLLHEEDDKMSEHSGRTDAEELG